MDLSPTMTSARPAPLERIAAFLRRDAHLWFVLLLTVPAMLPLLAPGYFMKAHDARHSIFFLVEFDRAFQDGALWPLWGPDHAVGFGYPTFLLYAPITFYIGEAFHLLGLGFAAATKATWALGFLLGATGTYRLARRWFTPPVALIASLAFTYAPYHLSQIYVRAALSEFMALGWLPWAVLAMLKLWDEPGPRRAVVATLALAALMLFHTVSTLMFVPVIGALLVVLLLRDLMTARRTQRSLGKVFFGPATMWTVITVILAVLLGCIFFVPMALERNYVAQWQWVGGTYNYQSHFVYPAQFLIPTWGYGYSVPGPNDGMSFQVGIAIFVLAVVGGAAVLFGPQPSPASPPEAAAGAAPGRSGGRLIAVFLLVVTALALFLMTPASEFVWRTLPFVDLIQFPWRLLAVTVFGFALLAAYGADALAGGGSASSAGTVTPFVYVVGLVLIVGSLPFTQPQLVPLRPQDESPLAVLDFEMAFPDMRGVTAWAQRQPTNDDSPLIQQYLAGQPLQRAAIEEGTGQILEQSARALSAQARVRADGPVSLRFYTYYFPGWRATIDGRPVPIRAEGPNGLIGLDVPAGEHEVQVIFGLTPARVAGRVLSVVGILGFALLAVLGARRARTPIR